MARICCEMNMGEGESSSSVDASSSSAKKRRMEINQFRLVASDSMLASTLEKGRKRHRVDALTPKESQHTVKTKIEAAMKEIVKSEETIVHEKPKYGSTSVCGRRRDMEDEVSIHSSFCNSKDLSFYGVYDGHGCSHVATRCRDRMHEIVKDELVEGKGSWEEMMGRSFKKMDEEVNCCNETEILKSNCKCKLEAPYRDAVGSTAVVAVVSPAEIIVANCGDSRAVLCRKGAAIPLSSDHKPDRPDELARIEKAGGRVLYWDGARVYGFLAMSRAIGDSYLKPYVISEPEVTISERSDDDECLIIASDGLWDVVSNETASGVARMCLKSRNTAESEKACSDASILLTKLALARHSTDNVTVVVLDLRTNL